MAQYIYEIVSIHQHYFLLDIIALLQCLKYDLFYYISIIHSCKILLFRFNYSKFKILKEYLLIMFILMLN